MNRLLPRANAPLLDARLTATTEFRRFLESLAQSSDASGLQQEIDAIILRLSALEDEDWLKATTMIQGQLTVAVQGTLSNGQVILSLINDVLSPGSSTYYGTDATGVKGWYPLPSGGTFNRIDTSGDPRVTADGNLRITA